MSDSFRLLLVGCGKMGGALLKRVLKSGFVTSSVVIEPSPPPAFVKDFPNVRWCATSNDIGKDAEFDIVVIAIKPQMIPAVLPSYAPYQKAVFLSIAAGITLSNLAGYLRPATSIVRTMPNLPASVGAGATAAIANPYVSAAQKTICDQFLKAVGTVAWLDTEDMLDAVTALSGSGPAYVFAICEAMAKAGRDLGLPETLAQDLARQTVIGSGMLMAQSPMTAAQLRQAVTSPGGTTEAALKILLKDEAINKLLHQAMQAAANRATELAQS